MLATGRLRACPKAHKSPGRAAHPPGDLLAAYPIANLPNRVAMP